MRFETVDRPIGLMEARTDATLHDRYAKQRGEISSEMSKRAGWLTRDRPFVAWDSEGYSLPDNSHHTMLWGCSSGHHITGDSIGTVEAFELLLRVEAQNPDVFHVIYAGNYDVNMILRDVPKMYLHRLKATNHMEWSGYRVEYFKSKWLRISKRGLTVTLYDVFTFFGTSFVKALEDYIGETDEDVLRIITGKKQRDSFGIADLPTVKKYWESELRYLVRLCERLRDYLATAGIRISKWHGPGAIASATLRQRGYRRVDLPPLVSESAQFGYAGGRFEAFKIGVYDGPVFQYDIRSAYPSAIAQLPKLVPERWHYLDTNGGEPIRDFSLYRVSVNGIANEQRPHIGPFPWRRRNGMVYYPPRHGGTWAWGSELRNALRSPWVDYIRIDDAYIYDDDGSRPFSWIAEMYDQRAEWKAQGEPAQLALKLAMNSIYGKLAQQIGAKYDRVSNQWTVPRFHQLEYAGYITSATRGALFSAMMQKPHAVIACETDAVFSTEPLDLTIGKGLGEWELTTYAGICYLQSGLYFAKELNGEWKPRTRGFTRNRMDYSRVLEYLTATSGYSSGGKPLVVTERRFRTMGTSLNSPDWRRWVDEPRGITVGMPGGKREHWPPACILCTSRGGNASYACGLHDTVPALWHSDTDGRTIDYSVPSTRYPLQWKGDPPSEYVDSYGDDAEWEHVYG